MANMVEGDERRASEFGSEEVQGEGCGAERDRGMDFIRVGGRAT